MPQAEISSSFDVYKILTLGAVGLTFLLMFLSYRLIRQVIDLYKSPPPGGSPPGKSAVVNPPVLLASGFLVMSLVILVAAMLLQRQAVTINLSVSPLAEGVKLPRILVDARLLDLGAQGAGIAQVGPGGSLQFDIYPLTHEIERLGVFGLQCAASTGGGPSAPR